MSVGRGWCEEDVNDPTDERKILAIDMLKDKLSFVFAESARKYREGRKNVHDTTALSSSSDVPKR